MQSVTQSSSADPDVELSATSATFAAYIMPCFPHHDKNGLPL